MRAAERTQRAAVIEEARSWLRTPYHHQGFVKSAGVDCAFLLVCVYHACDLIPWIDPRPYPPDWHFHRDEERYLKWVEQYARPVKTPQPGDLALYKFGRCVSHGAIVVEWPTIIHAARDEGCVIAEGDQGRLADHLAIDADKGHTGFWSLWRGR